MNRNDCVGAVDGLRTRNSRRNQLERLATIPFCPLLHCILGGNIKDLYSYNRDGPASTPKYLADPLGFEPRSKASAASALPLCYGSIVSLCSLCFIACATASPNINANAECVC